MRLHAWMWIGTEDEMVGQRVVCSESAPHRVDWCNDT